MSNLEKKIDESQRLIESMNMVEDIDKTTKLLNARLRELMLEPVTDGQGRAVSMSDYVGEIKAISENIKALADYRNGICRM